MCRDEPDIQVKQLIEHLNAYNVTWPTSVSIHKTQQIAIIEGYRDRDGSTKAQRKVTIRNNTHKVGSRIATHIIIISIMAPCL